MGEAFPPDGFEERAVEPEDEVHPPTLEQSNPWFLSQIVYYVIAFVTQNGWFCVLAIACYYLWSRFQPKVQELKARRERDNEAAEYHKDPDKFIAKERAIAAARQRMQEEYNRKSEQHLEDLKLREEQKLQQRVEENAQAPLGGRRLIESNKSTLNTVNKNKDKGKPRLRPEYNPLMGDSSSSSSSGWRPSRRTGGG